MKKFLAVLLMLAMLLCGVAFAEDTAPALTKDVVVLFTSDVHCGIDQGWGYATACRQTTMWCLSMTATRFRAKPSAH
mgnify:CR=1 FL=1